MFKAPTLTPAFSTLVDDLVTRDFRKIARHLDITPETLKKWYQSDSAPRMAYLAIFWETRWGLSTLDCDIWNRDTLRVGLIRALNEEKETLKSANQSLQWKNEALKLQIEALTKPTQAPQAANDPSFVNVVTSSNTEDDNNESATLKLHNNSKLSDSVPVVTSILSRKRMTTGSRIF